MRMSLVIMYIILKDTPWSDDEDKWSECKTDEELFKLVVDDFSYINIVKRMISFENRTRPFELYAHSITRDVRHLYEIDPTVPEEVPMPDISDGDFRQTLKINNHNISLISDWMIGVLTELEFMHLIKLFVRYCLISKDVMLKTRVQLIAGTCIVISVCMFI